MFYKWREGGWGTGCGCREGGGREEHLHNPSLVYTRNQINLTREMSEYYAFTVVDCVEAMEIEGHKGISRSILLRYHNIVIVS